MQLIRITNLPIQYRYAIEHGHLEINQANKPEGIINHQPSSLQMQSKNIQVNINTDAMYESMNLRGTGAWAKELGDRGMQMAQKATGESVQFGNEMARIQDGVTIAQIVQSRFMNQTSITTYTTFIPSVGPEISWEPAELDIQYDPGSLEIDWQIMQNAMNYIPGKFSMEILQYPKVSIEYIGGIHYVPPSAAPDYQDPV